MNNETAVTSIKLPKSILQEIGVDTKGDFQPENGQRKRVRLTRKEKRKKERDSKKRKISKNKTRPTTHKNLSNSHEKDTQDSEDEFMGFGDDGATSEDVFSALKAVKTKGSKVTTKSQIKEPASGSSGSSGSSSQPDTADDVFRALAAAKAEKTDTAGRQEPSNRVGSKKSAKTVEDMDENDTWAALKAMKENKNKKKTSKATEYEEKEKEKSKPSRRLPEHEDPDMAYYARMLGMKSTKDKLSKEDDGLDDILSGLDFDEDMSEDDESEGSDLSNLSDSEDSETESISDDATTRTKQRENIYVAPSTDLATAKYVPPSRRAKLQESSQESEQVIRLKRQVKGLLNKVSDSNMIGVVNELSQLYNNNVRNELNSIITNTILDSIALQGTLLESFLIVHATVATALYRVVGVEFGAYFVQTVTERFEKYYNEQKAIDRVDGVALSKEAVNVLALITEIYSLQLVSCKLVYDLIKLFLTELTEMNTELLLHIIRNAGPQLRADDPSSLRDIIYLLQESVVKHKKEVGSVGSRTQFLIEMISDLKNNKHSNISEGTIAISQRMKKFLGSYGKGDPLQVTLDDLHNVETRGKWWIVGAAWKNKDEKDETPIGNRHDADEEDDENITKEYNWMDLARNQRMNTDIRRAIFVAIMSSDDYMDAYERLQRLSLKHKQEQDIPFIVLHCCANEAVYNPFYSLLAYKLCAQHNIKKGFEFCLWDHFNELDESPDSDASDAASKQKTMHYAKFYGSLVARGAMSLDILKQVNFFTASVDTQVFSELFFVTLFNAVAKNAEKQASVKLGYNADTSRDPKDLVKILAATKDKTTLRGIEFFQTQVLKSDWAESEKQKRRLEWGVDIVRQIVPEILDSVKED